MAAIGRQQPRWLYCNRVKAGSLGSAASSGVDFFQWRRENGICSINGVLCGLGHTPTRDYFLCLCVQTSLLRVRIFYGDPHERRRLMEFVLQPGTSGQASKPVAESTLVMHEVRQSCPSLW
jgi:hypothetical protein